MHRFFAEPGQISDNRVVLTGPEIRHARTVLRLKAGECVEVLDGQGGRYEVCLTRVRKDRVEGEIQSRRSPAGPRPLDIRMGLALLKGKAFENVLRQAVELGVGAVTPVLTERCVSRWDERRARERLDRWRAIAREAAKQCGQVYLPRLDGMQSLEKFCEDNQGADLRLMFWEEEKQRSFQDWTPEKPPASVAFLSGPEGGFAPSEVERARQYGFVSLSLGPRTLRAETAPSVILSLIQFRWGDLGAAP